MVYGSFPVPSCKTQRSMLAGTKIKKKRSTPWLFVFKNSYLSSFLVLLTLPAQICFFSPKQGANWAGLLSLKKAFNESVEMFGGKYPFSLPKGKLP